MRIPEFESRISLRILDESTKHEGVLMAIMHNKLVYQDNAKNVVFGFMIRITRHYSHSENEGSGTVKPMPLFILLYIIFIIVYQPSYSLNLGAFAITSASSAWGN